MASSKPATAATQVRRSGRALSVWNPISTVAFGSLDADWMDVRLVAGHPAGMGVAAPPAGQFRIGANTLTDHRRCQSVPTLPCAMRSRLPGHDHSVERLRTARSAGLSREGTFFIPVRPNAFGHPQPSQLLVKRQSRDGDKGMAAAA